MTIVLLVCAVLLSLCGLTLLGCAFMAIRNDWVYRARMSVLQNPKRTIDQQIADHDLLPSYDAMLWRVFEWKLSNFLPSELPQ